jgi:type IV secretory pathway TrbD component
VLWCGVERRLLIAACLVDYAVFQFAGFIMDHSIILAIPLLALFWFAARRITKTDPQLLMILVRNVDQKTYYDPFQ